MRHLTRTALLAAPLAALAMAGGMAEAQTKTIRFSHAGPPPDFLNQGTERFAAIVNEADMGLNVEVYPASSLFRQGTEVPAIQRGNLEMSIMTTFEVAAQMPDWGFLNRAYLFRDYDHMMSVMTGPLGEELVAEVAEQMDIEILSVAYLGTRTLNLRNARDVNGPEDLAGIKLRMPATPEWLLLGETLGVEPTPMAMPEIYVALQTGGVDGQENPLTITNAARFYEVTEQIVLTAHMVQPVFYAISKPVFDGLSADQQDLLRRAAAEGAELGNSGRVNDEEVVAERMANELNMRVDEIDLSAFRAHADAVYERARLARDWNTERMTRAMQ
ncbi:MAG: TRAP transporter substrate-binding protein DctP [Rhodobacteraceae bacterium]|nr:TRAP transporter substrate-binding protein DctP [Paracoccaceae bacterium]